MNKRLGAEVMQCCECDGYSMALADGALLCSCELTDEVLDKKPSKKSVGVVLIYRDDGPNGMCGQTVECTRPHMQVWLCRSEKQARQLAKRWKSASRTRRHVRWDIVTPGNEDGLGELVDMTNVNMKEILNA
jgi:hypothetical protein